MDPKYIKEHETLPQEFDPQKWNDSFVGKKLFKWTEPLNENDNWAYKAYYRIGTEWIDKENALIVTTKQGLENIDFVSMFLQCFDSGIELARLSAIYDIELDKPPINAKSLSTVLNPLIEIHFLTVVEKIVSMGLKKDYMPRTENLKKVKGRISPLRNERRNAIFKRFDRFYCTYDEFTLDNYENRLIKKALLLSSCLLLQMSNHRKFDKIQSKYIKCLSAFEYVSDQVEHWEVRNVKTNKLYPEYNEAVRLAKMILKRTDSSIHRNSTILDSTPPFWIDMSLLYELYVYGLLRKTYGNSVMYQENGVTGKPDFMFCSDSEKLILDTKYIPRFDNNSNQLDTDIIRQLSGYCRDAKLLKRLRYNCVSAPDSIPVIPCVIIYPKEKTDNPGLFCLDAKKTIIEQCIQDESLLYFYRLCINLPTIV